MVQLLCESPSTSAICTGLVALFCLLLRTCEAKYISTHSGAMCGISSSDKEPARWGHIYIDGALESVEFYSAGFSTLFPCESTEIVVAEPRDACAKLEGRAEGMFVLVERGSCTFAQKAQFAASANASGMIVVNSNNALLAMPRDNSTSKPEILPSVMIRKRAGLLIEHALKHGRVTGSIVGEVQLNPTLEDSVKPCGPCQGQKTPLPAPPTVTGGVLRLDEGESFEFLASGMGGMLRLNERYELVRFLPTRACTHFAGTTEQRKQIIGKAVLIDRGRCPFSLKLEHAKAAGASMVVFANSDTAPIALAGALDKEKNPGSDAFVPGTLLPSIIVYYRAGRQLSKVLEDEKVLGFTLKPTDLDISDMQGSFDMYDMDQWDALHSKRLKQLQTILPKTKTATGEREAEVRRLFELAEVHYSL